jgi:hypothetical protein
MIFFCDSFYVVRSNLSSVEFLFIGEVIRGHFCTNLPYVQSVLRRLFHTNHLSNHSNAQTSILPTYFADYHNVFSFAVEGRSGLYVPLHPEFP